MTSDLSESTKDILAALRDEHRKFARAIALRDEMLWSASRIIAEAHDNPSEVERPGFVLGCMAWRDRYEALTSEDHVD